MRHSRLRVEQRAQGGKQDAVGGQPVDVVEVVGPEPPDGGVLDGPRFFTGRDELRGVDAEDLLAGQRDVLPHACPDLDDDVELFAALAGQRESLGLAFLDPATGQFPLPRVLRRPGPLLGEQLAVPHQGGTHDHTVHSPGIYPEALSQAGRRPFTPLGTLQRKNGLQFSRARPRFGRASPHPRPRPRARRPRTALRRPGTRPPAPGRPGGGPSPPPSPAPVPSRLTRGPGRPLTGSTGRTPSRGAPARCPGRRRRPPPGPTTVTPAPTPRSPRARSGTRCAAGCPAPAPPRRARTTPTPARPRCSPASEGPPPGAGRPPRGPRSPAPPGPPAAPPPRPTGPATTARPAATKAARPPSGCPTASPGTAPDPGSSPPPRPAPGWTRPAPAARAPRRRWRAGAGRWPAPDAPAARW